ncbi:MAG: putative baseplate assembly protein [Candidatus Pristimantibacillus sp.]
MLPKLPLDDRTYTDIVDQSRRMIPKRVPEWTDENAHDPGMTFLELFAWLTEMQRYYISRVPDKNRMKFVGLLGIKPTDVKSAEAEVRFGNITMPLTVPRGTKLMAEDQMFETEESVSLVPLALDHIISRTELEANDVTASNDQMNVAFYSFGKEAAAGSRMYISFDRGLAVSEQVSISVKLHDNPNRVGAYDASSLTIDRAAITPSAKLSWKAYAMDEASGSVGWLPLEVIEDETLHFTLNGKITLRNKAMMLPITVHPANDRFRYWICCTVEQAGYEMPPRLSSIMLHTVKVVQRDTLCETMEYMLQGDSQQAIHVPLYLALYGEVKLQIQQLDDNWIYCKPSQYTIKCDEVSGEAIIQLIETAIPSVLSKTCKVRVIASVPEFDRYRMVGRSNGLPGQTFELYELPCSKKDAISLQVGVPGRDGELKWEDWTRVDDFDHSTSSDRHFTYNPIKRLLQFGNSERGAIPAVHAEPNICIIACELGGGERGNVKPQLISQWVNKSQQAYGLTVSNSDYASGGKEEETLSQTLQRAQVDLKQTFRAVTNEDYETIVKSTPGVNVARVQAIPLFKPGLSDYPREKAPGQVSVVVVPFSLSDTPQPSAGFLQTVKRHLDTRRLVTTEVHIIPPVYIKLTVHAVVVMEPQFIDEGPAIAAALRGLLRPLDGDGDSKGWAFGRPVYKGDIYNALSGRNGVVFIQDLWLDADGPHVNKSKGGDIILPPHGLVFSGQHEIELVSRTHL